MKIQVNTDNHITGRELWLRRPKPPTRNPMPIKLAAVAQEVEDTIVKIMQEAASR